LHRTTISAYHKEANNCGQLEEEIEMAVGARVILRRITGTEVGLVNRVMGIVVGFEWPEGVPKDHLERQATAIKVLVHNERVGQKARQVARERDGIVGVMFPTPQCSSPLRGTSCHWSWPRL